MSTRWNSIGCFVFANMFKIDFTINVKDWMRNPEKRWNAGLEGSGLQFRQRLQRQHYPPQPPLSHYIRTGTLANKAGFNIEDFGRVMVFGSTFYLPYLLDGPENWAGKRDELFQYMVAGFKEGVKNYKE